MKKFLYVFVLGALVVSMTAPSASAADNTQMSDSDTRFVAEQNVGYTVLVAQALRPTPTPTPTSSKWLVSAQSIQYPSMKAQIWWPTPTPIACPLPAPERPKACYSGKPCLIYICVDGTWIPLPLSPSPPPPPSYLPPRNVCTIEFGQVCPAECDSCNQKDDIFGKFPGPNAGIPSGLDDIVGGVGR